MTVGNINTSASGTYTIISSTSVAGDINSADNADTVNVVITNTPLSSTITATDTAICGSGSTTITATPAGGSTPYSYNWSTGATTQSITTPVLSANQTYTVTITDLCGSTTSKNITIVVNNPQIISSAGATRCGPGPIALTATPSSGATTKWYAVASGDTAIATGATFSTSVLATTTYYAEASIGYTTQTSSNGVPTVGTTSTNVGVVLDITKSLILNSVDLYATVAGNAVIELRNSAGTTIQGPLTVSSLTASGLSTPQTVALNWNIPVGTGYKLLVTTHTATLGYHTGSFPSALGNGAGSIVNGATATGTSTLNYYFYNLRTSIGCASARTPVTATVTTPPAITTTNSNPYICSGGSSTLGVSSANANYTYTWTPGNLSGPTQTVSPASTTKYYVGAYDGNCAALDSVTVIVQPNATIAADNNTLCQSGVAVLTASPSGFGPNSLQWQTSSDNITFTDISGATNDTYTTPTLTSTTYYKLLIKNSNNQTCSQPTRTITVNSPQITGTTPGVRCGPGTVNLSATASAGSTIKWYAAASGDTAIYVGPSFTTPVVTATRNFYVNATKGGGGTQTVGANDMTIGSFATWSSTAQYVNFTVTSAATIQSVDMFWSSAVGTAFSVTIRDASTLANVFTYNGTTTIQSTTTPQVVPLNATLPPGNYQMNLGSATATTYRNSTGGVYPYTIPGVLSITGNTFDPVYYYMFYRWVVSSGCESARTPVSVTINAAPAISTSANQNDICPSSSTTLNVTSSNANYTYSWTPGNLTGASVNVSPTATTKYYVMAEDAGTTCSNLDSVTVRVQPAATITSSANDVCYSGSVTLTANPATGYAAGTLQWQSSPDSITFTNISGQTGVSYTTPVLTNSTYYRLVIKNGALVICSQPTKKILVNKPQMMSTTGRTRCGTGSVTLQAVPSTGASVRWYAAASGGTAIATTNNFVTPAISTTTTYYAAAVQGGTFASVGLTDRVGSTTNTGYADIGLMFDAYSAFVLQSVAMYPVGTGGNASITIALKNSAGTVLESATVSVPTSATPGVKTIVPLNFNVPVGTDHRLVVTAATGLTGLIRELTSGFTYPYTLPGVASITSAYTSGASASYYYYMYDWKVSTACETARTAVVATVTSATPITASATSKNVCSGIATTLNAASANANYTYLWTPGFHKGSSFTVSPSNTTKYYVSSLDSSTGCSALDSVIVTVQPAPVLQPVTNSVCGSGSTTINANPSTGYATNTLQWQSSANGTGYNNISGATSPSYTTPVITSSTFYRLLVKDSSGNLCSQPSTVIYAYNPQVTATSGGSRCGTGTVNLSAVPSPGANISWYADATGGLAIGTGSSFTTPSISATTTYYASAAVGSTVKSLGLTDRVGSTTNTGYSDVGLMFDATASFVLQSVALYPVGTASSASLTIALKNSAGAILQTTTVTVTPSASPGIKTVVPLNFTVPAGTNHRLVMTAATGLTGLIRELTSGFTYPYTLPGVASITSAYTGGASASYYYYFYDWKVVTGCESGRTPVVATVTSSTPAVSIAITSGSNPTCAGGPITFTATPTVGGTNPSYQWKKNGNNVGTNSATYTDSGLTAGTITVVMTSNSSCASTPTATSNSIAFTVTNASWTGAVSTNWNLGNNWCSGTVPTAATDVTIASGLTNYPVLGANSEVRNLTIQTGATVTLGARTLDIKGTFTAAGTGGFIGTRDSKLTLSAPNATTGLAFASGGNSLSTLTIAGSGSTVNVTGILNIFSELTVSAGTLNTGGLLTIKSSANGTARVAPVAGTITGNVIVERYLQNVGHRAWRLLSVPVKGSETFHTGWQENQAPNANGLQGFGTLITGPSGTGMDATTSGYSLLSYVQGNPGSYTGVTNTNNSMQTTGGWMIYIRGDRSASPTGGTLYNVTPTTLRTKGALYTGTQTPVSVAGSNNQTLIGNIYASAIDFTALTKTGVSGFKVWDPALGDTAKGAGGYQTFAAATGYEPTPGGGSYPMNVPNTRIESGQAFFVSSTTGGSITFTEAAKTTGSRNVLRTSGTVKQFKTNLYAETKSGAQLADGNAVVFDNTYSADVDDNDVAKVSNMNEDLAIVTKGTKLAVEARPFFTTDDVIVYNLKGVKQQSYTFEFIPRNLDASVTEGYLVDKFLNTRTRISLTQTSTVTFEVTSDAKSSAADRFSVEFKNKTAPVKPAITVNDEKVISVYPNPVVDGRVSVQMTNAAEGSYSVRLINNTGSTVYTGKINHTGNTSVNQVKLSSRLAAGTYQLEVTGKDGSSSVQNIIISNK